MKPWVSILSWPFIIVVVGSVWSNYLSNSLGNFADLKPAHALASSLAQMHYRGPWVSLLKTYLIFISYPIIWHLFPYFINNNKKLKLQSHNNHTITPPRLDPSEAKWSVVIGNSSSWHHCSSFLVFSQSYCSIMTPFLTTPLYWFIACYLVVQAGYFAYKKITTGIAHRRMIKEHHCEPPNSFDDPSWLPSVFKLKLPRYIRSAAKERRLEKAIQERYQQYGNTHSAKVGFDQNHSRE